MGETDLHRDAMFRKIELLKRFFVGQKVYVSGDLLVYYEAGNNKKSIVPDVFFTKGLKQTQRRIYRTWIERLPPNFVIETTSKKTKRIPPRADGSLMSEQLGLNLQFNDGELEFIEPDTNQRLRTAEEKADSLREELRILRERIGLAP
ncbi:MAG: Uma2 family endonuclease [Planctomycetales bacterium]|nr:Uma2 family endonuclease [Planctomycetales bacterium]